MAWQVRGVSIYRAREDHEVVTSVPHSRDFLDITILSIYLLSNLDYSMVNILLLHSVEHYRRLPCLLSTVLKPRELMFLADKLLRMDCNKDHEVKKAIKLWSPTLRGSALFRIAHNRWTSLIIKSFGKNCFNGIMDPLPPSFCF